MSIYEDKDKSWIDGWTERVRLISLEKSLRDLKFIPNLKYNCILSGFQGDTPVILKLGLEIEAIQVEAAALRCFEGCGAINIVDAFDNVLILERAVPGTSLKNYFLDREKDSIEIVCWIMKKLHAVRIPKTHNFPHIRDWLKALDKDWGLPSDSLRKARKLRDQLLKTAMPDVLLHGDLHHDNILQNGENWLVIDPKGVIGEPVYEVAAFIRNPIPELLNHIDAPNIIHNRVTQFAELLELPSQRILDWCFVQAVLSWVWAIEDGCDTSYFEHVTKVFNKT